MHRSRAPRGRGANSSSAGAGPVHGRRERDDGRAEMHPRQKRRLSGIGYGRRLGSPGPRRNPTGWLKMRKPVRDETVRFCEHCNRHFYDDNAFIAHVRGRRHRNTYWDVQGQEAIENEMENSDESESDICFEEPELSITQEEKIRLFKEEFEGKGQLPPEFVKWCEKSLSAPGVGPDRKKAIYHEIASEYAVAKQQGNLLSITWSARPPATGALYMAAQPAKQVPQPTFGPNFGVEKAPTGGEGPLFTGLTGTSMAHGRGRWFSERPTRGGGLRPVGFQSKRGGMTGNPSTKSEMGRGSRGVEETSGFRPRPAPPNFLMDYKRSSFQPRSRAAKRLLEICSRPDNLKLRLLYERDFAIHETEEDEPLVGTANFELVPDGFDFERKRTMDLVRPLEILMRAFSRVKKLWREDKWNYTKFKRQLDAILADMRVQQIKSVELMEVYEAYAEAALTVYEFDDAGMALSALMDLYQSSTEIDPRFDRFIAFWIFYKMRTAKFKHELHLLLNWCPIEFVGKETKFALKMLSMVYNSNYANFFFLNDNMYEVVDRSVAQLRLSSLDPFCTMMRSKAVERLSVCYRCPSMLNVETVSVIIGFRYCDGAGNLIPQVDQTLQLLKKMKIDAKKVYEENTKVLALDCHTASEKLDNGEAICLSGGLAEPHIYD